MRWMIGARVDMYFNERRTKIACGRISPNITIIIVVISPASIPIIILSRNRDVAETAATFVSRMDASVK